MGFIKNIDIWYRCIAKIKRSENYKISKYLVPSMNHDLNYDRDQSGMSKISNDVILKVIKNVIEIYEY